MEKIGKINTYVRKAGEVMEQNCVRLTLLYLVMPDEEFSNLDERGTLKFSNRAKVELKDRLHAVKGMEKSEVDSWWEDGIELEKGALPRYLEKEVMPDSTVMHVCSTVSAQIKSQIPSFLSLKHAYAEVYHIAMGPADYVGNYYDFILQLDWKDSTIHFANAGRDPTKLVEDDFNYISRKGGPAKLKQDWYRASRELGFEPTDKPKGKNR